MTPRFSIIIPTYNENKINQHIFDLKAKLFDYAYEIIVSDGSPQHATLKLIKDTSVIQVKSKPGRGNGLADGASAASGDILWFVHGDTVVPDNPLQLINNVLINKEFAAGAFELGISSPKLTYRIIEFGTNTRTKLTRIPYGDQTLFIKKEIYDSIGGFKRLPLMEDVEIMQNLKRSGRKIKILHQKAYTSPRRWEKEGPLYTTIRNQIIISLYYLGVSPEKLVQWYRAHKK